MSVQLTYEESHGMQESRYGVTVIGPTTRVGLKDELLAELPATMGPLVFKSFSDLSLIPGYDDVWKGSVTYGAMKEKEELRDGQNEFRFQSVKEQFTQTISPSSRCTTPRVPSPPMINTSSAGRLPSEKRKESPGRNSTTPSVGRWRSRSPSRRSPGAERPAGSAGPFVPAAFSDMERKPAKWKTSPAR